MLDFSKSKMAANMAAKMHFLPVHPTARTILVIKSDRNVRCLMFDGSQNGAQNAFSAIFSQYMALQTLLGKQVHVLIIIINYHYQGVFIIYLRGRAHDFPHT